MKVLIVDDSSRMRGMMCRYLPAAAKEIHECEDGFDALDCYERFLPDRVLMDWEMKRMNGLKATRKIVGKYPDAKILPFTLYTDIELRETTAEAGACGFVLKEDLAELRQFLAASVEPPIFTDGESGKEKINEALPA